MSTTESVESVHSLEPEAVPVEVILASLKKLAAADLFKVSKATLIQAEKVFKAGKQEPKVPKEKKETPKQLRKPKAWVNWVLKYVQANGWEAFDVENKKANEIIEMSASEENEAGVHLFPDGKKMTLTLAMSLSKLYWAAKDKTGIHPELYEQFESEYVEAPEEEDEAEVVEEKPKMVRKTAAEKAAEQAAAAAKKTADADAKKAAKAPKKAVAAATAKTVVKVPAKAAKAAPVAAVKASGVKPGPKKKDAVPAWTCPNDGNVYPWTFKGKALLRNFENQIWAADGEGGCGDWQGLYLPEEDRIDDSAADPFGDEE